MANLKQCILALAPRLTGPEHCPILVFNLTDQYPNLEPQGLLPEVLKKVVTTYEMVGGSQSCSLYLRSNNTWKHKWYRQKNFINYHYYKHKRKILLPFSHGGKI